MTSRFSVFARSSRHTHHDQHHTDRRVCHYSRTKRIARTTNQLSKSFSFSHNFCTRRRRFFSRHESWSLLHDASLLRTFWMIKWTRQHRSLFTFITSNISWQSLQTRIKKDLKKNINLETLIKTSKNVDWLIDWLIDWRREDEMKWKKNLYSRQNYELRLIKRDKNALFRSNSTNYV
jgi:hypothetical protein